MSVPLKTLLVEYGIIKDQIKELDEKLKPLNAQKDNIREAFAEYLHKKQTNEIIMADSTGKSWKIYYRKGQKRIDYEMLLELAGQEIYNEVVSQGEYIVIGNAPKSKKPKDTSKTQTAPVSTTTTLPPTGDITF